MRKIFVIIAVVLFSIILQLDPAAASMRDSVLKVFVTFNSMDYYRPWQSHGSASKTGSACIISGNRILTNAHVVSDSTFIQVRKNSDPNIFLIYFLVLIWLKCDSSAIIFS